MFNLDYTNSVAHPSLLVLYFFHFPVWLCLDQYKHKPIKQYCRISRNQLLRNLLLFIESYLHFVSGYRLFNV